MQASISKKSKFKHVFRTFILVLLFILLAETESCQPDTAWGEVPYELCSVTFLSGGADLMDDLQKADVILDIYQVASLLQESTLLEFQYQVLPSFDNVDLSNIESKDDWITAAATALDNIIADTNNAIVPVTYDADGTYTMNAGVYLIVPHSRALTDKREYLQEITDDAGDSYYVSIASTDDCDYLYTPQMLVIPNLIQDQNGHIEWNDQLTIVLKPNPFYHTGDLIIIKNTEGFQSSDAQTFVFQVEAYLTENEKAEHVFSDTVSAQIAGNGQQTIEIPKRIPVGAEVTVTEIYHGANAKPKNGVSERQTVIQQDIPAVVEFTNIPTDTHTEENVIVNTFQFSSTEGWSLIEPVQEP